MRLTPSVRRRLISPPRPVTRGGVLKHPVTMPLARQVGAAHGFEYGDDNHKAFHFHCGRLRDVGHRSFEFLELRSRRRRWRRCRPNQRFSKSSLHMAPIAAVFDQVLQWYVSERLATVLGE